LGRAARRPGHRPGRRLRRRQGRRAARGRRPSRSPSRQRADRQPDRREHGGLDLGAPGRSTSGARRDRAVRDARVLGRLPGRVTMDTAKMEAGIRLFLEGIGPAAAPPDVAETPARVARAWADDLIAGYAVDPASELTWTEAPEGCGPVLVR